MECIRPIFFCFPRERDTSQSERDTLQLNHQLRELRETGRSSNRWISQEFIEDAKASASLALAKRLAHCETKALKHRSMPIKGVIRTSGAIGFLVCTLVSLFEYILRTALAMLTLPLLTSEIASNESNSLMGRFVNGAVTAKNTGLSSLGYALTNLNPTVKIKRSSFSALDE